LVGDGGASGSAFAKPSVSGIRKAAMQAARPGLLLAVIAIPFAVIVVHHIVIVANAANHNISGSDHKHEYRNSPV